MIDLSVTGSRVVDPVALDANIAAAGLLSSYPGQRPASPARAREFLRALIASNGLALLTPTAYNEVLHAARRAKYQQALAARRSTLIASYGVRARDTWLDLDKIAPSILRGYATELERLRLELTANNVVIVGHDGSDPIPSGLSYDQDLVRLVGRYGLDTSDATIPLEAQRMGLSAIVTFDRDLRRAAADFDIYTWL